MTEEELREIDQRLGKVGAQLKPKCGCGEVDGELGDSPNRFRWKYCPYCGKRIVWSFGERAERQKSTDMV